MSITGATTPRNRFTRVFLAGCLGLALAGSAAQAGTSGRWLHIRVVANDADGEQVNVNLPLDMIATFLPMIQTDDMRGGKIRIDSHFDTADFGTIDLRKILEALREAPDTDFVTVRSNDENVRVTKEAGFIKILAEDRSSAETVRVTVPIAVMDALISGDGQELDLLAALEALSEFDGDIVTVDSEEEQVRIWIDSNQNGD